MPADLTDNYVANTYKGVLHVNGEELPAVDKIQVYDGAGNETAIKLGSNSVDCLSLSAQGLTANNFKYPDVPGNSFNVLTQVSDSSEGEVNTLELRNIQDVFCGANAGASYIRSSDSTVPVIETQCGLVRSVNDVEITSITRAAGGASLIRNGVFNIAGVNVTDGIVRGLTLVNVAPPPTTPPPFLSARIRAFVVLESGDTPVGVNLKILNSYNVVSVTRTNATRQPAPSDSDAGGTGQYIINLVPGTFTNGDYVILGTASDTDHVVVYRSSSANQAMIFTRDTGQNNNQTQRTGGRIMVVFIDN